MNLARRPSQGSAAFSPLTLRISPLDNRDPRACSAFAIAEVLAEMASVEEAQRSKDLISARLPSRTGR